jgi:hypothetical protein
MMRFDVSSMVLVSSIREIEKMQIRSGETKATGVHRRIVSTGRIFL